MSDLIVFTLLMNFITISKKIVRTLPVVQGGAFDSVYIAVVLKLFLFLIKPILL